MDYKDVEQKLKEAAEQIKVRDFSLVWENVKKKVRSEKPVKRHFHFQWQTALATAAACVVIASPFVAIPFLDAPAPIYLSENLEAVSVEKEEFETQLKNVNIQIVNLSNYYVIDYALYETDTNEVKGGKIDLTDDLNNSTCWVSVSFYEENVQLDDITVQYDLTYTVGSAVIEYRVKEAYPTESMYVYDIKANCNGVNYLMEYTCLTDDITPFLQEFFS